MKHSKQTCNLKSFETHFNAGQTQLVWSWVSGDLETPLSAYLKLCRDEPNCFLLESVEGGATLGRYSIIGLAPDTLWRCDGSQVNLWKNYGGWEAVNDHPLTSLRDLIKECHIDAPYPDLPPMAVSGLFGYMGYDMVRLIEDITDENPDELNIPDSILGRPTVLIIFDNIKNMICLVKPVYRHAKNTSEEARTLYNEAIDHLKALKDGLSSGIDPKLLKHKTTLTTPLEVSSTMTQKEYEGAVKKAVEYIRQGEIFQVVPGQRFSVDFDLPAIELYRALRHLNPSPFMFHLSFEGFSIIGSSPEILVRVRNNTLTIRPIAGTRPRGSTSAEDQALADDLLGDPKERAEHLMLLDLGRNDVGRVSKPGTVKVTEDHFVEYYSHVMHIVSNVEGELREDLDILDALFAGFPAGTVSGAPKVRAMEIIEELEANRRSYYGGCVGYISGNGELDTCIALRTALVKDGKIYVQAGAGIVADSDPTKEYEETVNKAKALIHAAEMAIEHTL